MTQDNHNVQSHEQEENKLNSMQTLVLLHLPMTK